MDKNNENCKSCLIKDSCTTETEDECQFLNEMYAVRFNGDFVDTVATSARIVV